MSNSKGGERQSGKAKLAQAKSRRRETRAARKRRRMDAEVSGDGPDPESAESFEALSSEAEDADGLLGEPESEFVSEVEAGPSSSRPRQSGSEPREGSQAKPARMCAGEQVGVKL